MRSTVLLLGSLALAAAQQGLPSVKTEGGSVVISSLQDVFIEDANGVRTGLNARFSAQQDLIDAMNTELTRVTAELNTFKSSTNSAISSIHSLRALDDTAASTLRTDVGTLRTELTTAIALVNSNAYVADARQIAAVAVVNTQLTASIAGALASALQKSYFMRLSGSQTLHSVPRGDYSGGWNMNCAWQSFRIVHRVNSNILWGARTNALERSLLTYMGRQGVRHLMSFSIMEVEVREGAGNGYICPWRRTNSYQYSPNQVLTSAAFTYFLRAGSRPATGWYLNGHNNTMNRWQLTGAYQTNTGRELGGYAHLHPNCHGCKFYMALPATVYGKFDLAHTDAPKRWWHFPSTATSYNGRE